MTTTTAVRDRTITEHLADHVHRLRFEEIPDAVVERAKEHLVHHLGVALRSVESGDADTAVGLARELSGGTGDFTILGSPHRVGLLDAVFANSVMMGHRGLDDVILPSGVHPGAIVIPTALATVEATRASGRDLIAALVVGYDVMGTLCSGVWTWGLDVPRRPNNVFGPFGGAATAARLLGLSVEQTVHALGHAGQSGMGIVEGVDHLWTMNALLARNGLIAAKLAQAGVPAASEIVEGTHGVFASMVGTPAPEGLGEELGTLGESFEITRAVTKRVPASAVNILAFEMMLALVNEHSLTPERVRTIEVELPEERAPREAVWERALVDEQSVTARAGSLPFRLALIVVDGHADPARCAEPPDPATRAVLERIRLRYSPGHPLRYARIEVTTTDGDRYVASGDEPQQEPLDRSAWLAEGGDAVLGPEQVSRAVGLIRGLEDVADAREVVECLARAGPPTDGA